MENKNNTNKEYSQKNKKESNFNIIKNKGIYALLISGIIGSGLLYKKYGCENINEILKSAKTLESNTGYKRIKNKAIKIEKSLNEDSSCSDKEIARNKLEILDEISIEYEIFMNTKFTKKSNSKLNILFRGIDKYNSISELKLFLEEIKLIISNEKSNLKDNYLGEYSFRDNVESNINFKGKYINGTYNETKEMEKFLNLFTIEYINFLNINNRKLPNIENSKIELNINELEYVVEKVKENMKNENYNFEIKFNLKDLVTKTMFLSKEDNNLNKNIENGLNNSGENILEKIEKYKNILISDSKLKKHFKLNVLNVKLKISRANYTKEQFEKLKLPEGIRNKLANIIKGLPAQESKYDNEQYNKLSGAFGIFQFTNINFIDSIKNGRILECPYLTKDEKDNIKKLRSIKKNIVKDNNYIDLKNSFKKSMKKITWLSGNYFEFLYKKLTKITKKDKKGNFETYNRTNFYKIMKIYNLNKEESEKFMVYMLINAYNTGGERINVLFKEFLKNIKENTISKNNALSLLEDITNFGKISKIGNLELYSKESSEYPWKVISGSKAVKYLQKNSVSKNKEENNFTNYEKSKNHFDEIPKEVRESSKKFSYSSVKNLRKFIENNKIIKGRKKYNGMAHGYCARGVKDFLIKYGVSKQNFGTNAYPGMYNYLEENSISLSEYKKNSNNKGKIFLKVPIDFPENAFPGGIVSYKNKSEEPMLIGSNARKRYGHIEIITRDSSNNKIYKKSKNIKGKEIHKDFRVLYDGFTIVTSGSTFNKLIKKWNITGKSYQEKLIKANKKLMKMGKDKYQEITGFTGYVYYLINL